MVELGYLLNTLGMAGQPTVMTEEVLRLLREAFEWGCTDREACLHAQIAQSTLYAYQLVNPEYVEWKEAWKDNPTLVARKCVATSLSSDKELSLKYLERKKKDEFSPRSEHTGADGKDMSITFAWVGEEEKQPVQIEQPEPLQIEE